ncbi:uncharacterized protein PV07_03987 [Cladophialophora immunda]|uniref:Aminoglycoside phosphotransferase domain-containing protein n=1 Tax=Cladophialophora immunda TaxID=569365 RepID=A0A0D2CR37_9EURO|nr:uncharacterized protein PV07_03987 [Cladophialophora immunda]KIW32440.1 hypothetical protein PV07_03987 [Cladophialophora immunda]
MDFDFAAYLRRLDPAYVYRVEKLAGGVVNVTARASKARFASPMSTAPAKTPSATLGSRGSAAGLDCGQGRFPGYGSLVLKHAPPFIAGVGESAPMSQGRQVGGEDGSSSLSLSTIGVLHHVAAASGVTVPRLLLHDPTDHVLVLSDLGPLPDLSKVFIELGGFTPDAAGAATAWQPPPSSPCLGHTLDAHEIARYRRIGEKLGTFFACLHRPSSVHSVLGALHTQGDGQQQRPRDTFPSLPEMKTAIHDHVIKPIRAHLLKFPSLLNEAEAETLFAAVEADFLRPTPLEEQCVVLGDCWTGAVLVDLGVATGEPNVDTDVDDVDVGVGIIDWEFASISGRGVNGDVSQFLAHLELLRVAAHTHPPGYARGHLSAVNAIIEGFISQYKPAQTRRFVRDGDSDDDDRVLRSAYLLHGAELINCAFWKTWICADPACPSCAQNAQSSLADAGADAGAGDPGSGPQCSVVTSLVRRGVSFLRCAVAPDPRRGTAKLRQDVAASLGLELDDAQTMGLYDLFEES